MIYLTDKRNGGVGDTYRLRQLRLQVKLSVKLSVLSLCLRLSYSGVATAGCLEAPSRCDRCLSVVVVPASIVEPRCGVAAPHCGVQHHNHSRRTIFATHLYTLSTGCF